MVKGMTNHAVSIQPRAGLWPFFVVGVIFGLTLTKAEIVSWFRIQEMFRFQAFHMYGVIGSAIATAALSVFLLKRFAVRTLDGETIQVAAMPLDGYRHVIGGTIFGLGWALTGACPGPLFILVGAGMPVMMVAIVSAVAGTWVHGYLRPKLPR
jgi:uncharacterized membrane protein YedE/YeeE